MLSKILIFPFRSQNVQLCSTAEKKKKKVRFLLVQTVNPGTDFRDDGIQQRTGPGPVFQSNPD